MRYMGIDYGTKRVGIAISDEGGEFALPFIVLNNSKDLVKEIVSIAKENKIEEIIMGESKDYKGKPNAIMPQVLNLKKDLEKKKLTVTLEPEFMTSENAERFQGKHDMLDASAAALILQSFLDKNFLTKFNS
jgi:putative Holliday junction resolvase